MDLIDVEFWKFQESVVNLWFVIVDLFEFLKRSS